MSEIRYCECGRKMFQRYSNNELKWYCPNCDRVEETFGEKARRISQRFKKIDEMEKK